MILKSRVTLRDPTVPSCDLQVIRVFKLLGYRKKRTSDINY